MATDDPAITADPAAPAATPAADPAAPPAPAPAPSGDVLSMLAEDMRADTALAGFKGKGVGDLAKGYAELSRTLGKDKIVVPGEDATPEDWAGVWSKLGRPETPDAYDFGDFEIPEGLPWNEETDRALTAKAHELGLTNTQLAGLRENYVALRAAEAEALGAQAEQSLQAAQESLKQEWGKDFDKHLDLAKRVAKHAFGDKLEEIAAMTLADGSPVLNHPDIARAFAKLGQQIAEPGALPGAGQGGAAFGAQTPDAARAEINRMMANPAYTDRSHPEHAALHKKVLDLYAVVNGESA